MARRRAGTPELTVIYWRDIPAQVTAKAGRERHQVLLDARFQHAIDRAAMVADKTDTDDYVAEWRQTTQPCDGDPASAAAERAAELEARYDRAVLDDLVWNGGSAPDPDADTEATAAADPTAPGAATGGTPGTPDLTSAPTDSPKGPKAP